MPPPTVPHQSDPQNSPQTVFLLVTYKPEEVNDGYWAVFRQLAMPRALITIFCTAFALGVGGVSSNLDCFDLFNGVLLLCLAGFVFPPLLCLYAFLLLRGRLMRSYDNRPNFHFPLTYYLDDLGCQIQYASGAGVLEWRYFTLALETPTAFVLASSVDDVFVLPKRCLESAAEVDTARRIIKEHVRNFSRARGRNVEIAFEKAETQRSIKEGVAEVVRVAEEAEGSEGSEKADSADNTEKSPARLVDQAKITANSSPELRATGDVLQFESPLNSGVAVEISYQSGEILKGEKIFFFRKRLIALARFYIVYLLWLPISFLLIGYVWGMLDYCKQVLNELRPYVLLVLPLFLAHALAIFLFVKRRTLQNEAYAIPFVFQFTEEGCGIRAGEKYAVLAWWHFKECWETEDQFLLLVGKRAQAMYIVPKRVFPDQAGLRYLKSLLQRKVTVYRDLIG
ncbi:MAG: YcxB family protein [Cyanobacteria bacterium REEB67]|nr:YcxB family protein [Cyanobacteria bacterium REEB67]